MIFNTTEDVMTEKPNGKFQLTDEVIDYVVELLVQQFQKKEEITREEKDVVWFVIRANPELMKECFTKQEFEEIQSWENGFTEPIFESEGQ